MTSDDRRSIELEVTVPGTPEAVWQAIATGPGITSWYVPHTIEEREGGATTSTFGSGPGMEIKGRVTSWEPPRRVVFEGDEDVAGPITLAFEWLVEARDGGSCVVRLVNTGFGEGDEWDAMYDGMKDGWGLFLLNLRLHLENFAGQQATPMLPGAHWPGDRSSAFARLIDALGIAPESGVGDRVAVTADGAPPLAGRIVEMDDWRWALLLDEPAPGTAFLAAEGPLGDENTATVSVWAYLYGPDRNSLAERDEPQWTSWLAAAGDA